MLRSDDSPVGIGWPRPTSNVTCSDFWESFSEIYSNAGRVEGVRASESKLKSGLRGGEIMLDVIVRGEERGSRRLTTILSVCCIILICWSTTTQWLHRVSSFPASLKQLKKSIKAARN